MNQIKHTVTVKVEYFTGMDEGDDGVPYYVASSDDLMFTTDGYTFEELLKNIRECLILCLKDGDSLADFNVDPNAKVQIVMNLPADYAEAA